MNVLEVIKLSFTNPTKLFEQVGKSKKNNIGFSFGYFALLSFVNATLGALVSLLFFSAFSSFFNSLGVLPGVGLQSFGYGFQALIGFVLGLGLSFVSAGLLHLWILIFGGKAGYAKTYEMGAYAGTPALLFGWIPFLGLIGKIWSLVLLIIATQRVHKIEKMKSILMYVIPFVVLFILGIILVVVALVFAAGTGILTATGGLV
ncbi:hypothetical protein HOI26_00490 [Candidatus Woesearchaeota archaeon]|jgi:hypothetical protein|nr:hypothetical protein [Candidatus Woesearchaeota archaeon]MBT5739551.1 hypothetical protein [Candidatus Woesearchaeota archaeon]